MPNTSNPTQKTQVLLRYSSAIAKCSTQVFIFQIM